MRNSACSGAENQLSPVGLDEGSCESESDARAGAFVPGEHRGDPFGRYPVPVVIDLDDEVALGGAARRQRCG